MKPTLIFEYATSVRPIVWVLSDKQAHCVYLFRFIILAYNVQALTHIGTLYMAGPLTSETLQEVHLALII